MTNTQTKKPNIWRIIRIGMTLLGIAMIAVAFLVDIVVGGLSGGIGPLQMTVAAIGLGIIIVAWIPLSAFGRGVLVVVSIIIMIVVLEILLTVAGFKVEYSEPPNFNPNAPVELQFDPARICDDEKGCHFNTAYLREICNPDARNRNCRVNDYGLSSEHEFTTDTLPDDAYRILVLGDSFTWGASSDYGQGWVDILEDGLSATSNVIVWNAAMPGTGTRQAIITAENLMPIMHPDLVILGFHTGNDFADNLYPVDRFMDIILEDGTHVTTQMYSLDNNAEALRETPAIIYARAQGYTVSSINHPLEDTLRRTRLGTLFVGAYRVLTWDSSHRPTTEALLTELQTLVVDNGAEFFVLLIPEEMDAQSPTQKYRTAITALENTNIPYVDSLPLLEVADFQNENRFNKHWNNSAHSKAGEMMITCVQDFIDTGNLNCP